MDHPCNWGSSTAGRCCPTWRPRQSGCGYQDIFSARLSGRPGTSSSGSGELGPSVLWPLRTRHWSNRYQRLGCNRGLGRSARTPAESVRELSEAIDIIRGIWNVYAPGMKRIEVKHYRVSGTCAGPSQPTISQSGCPPHGGTFGNWSDARPMAGFRSERG
jgi:hypothetical protein